ncbi:ATP-binding protein [Streptomyces sp. NPDC004134]|uniref:ATP-binding protein n=1 Tax=Streptomyces sp. NPDC004134 TaxID=3364691 RepID=UPI00368E5C39
MPGQADAVTVARRLAREQMRRWGVEGEVGDSATLVLSELVTNALLHTGSRRIGCELRCSADRLRLAVTDQGVEPGSLRVQRSSADEQGRGLLLVTAVSSSWGAYDARPGPGLVVWAELQREVPAAGGAAAPRATGTRTGAGPAAGERAAG